MTVNPAAVTRRFDAGAPVGVVRLVQSRTEVSTHMATNGNTGFSQPHVTSRVVLDFRLDPGDGTVLPVSLRGTSLTGSVAEGDVVEVQGRMRNGTLVAHKIFNHSTGALVQPSWRKTQIVLGTIVGLFVLGVFVVVGMGLLGFFDEDVSRPRPGGPRPLPNNVGEDLRERARQECYADPAFTDEQCDFVYGPR